MSISSELPGISRLVRSSRVHTTRHGSLECHNPSSGGQMTTSAEVPEVEVGPFWVSDSPRDELVERVVDPVSDSTTRPAFAYALHVGGLNARRERDFVVAMRRGRRRVRRRGLGGLAGPARRRPAASSGRRPRTSAGTSCAASPARSGRIPRVALIGGPQGLAERAGTVLDEAGVANVVFVDNGFHSDWSETLDPDACGDSGHHRDRARRTPRDDLEPAPPRRAPAGTRPDVWRLVRDTSWVTNAEPLGCCAGPGWSGSPESPRLPSRLGPRYARGAGATAPLALSTLHRRPPDPRL